MEEKFYQELQELEESLWDEQKRENFDYIDSLLALNFFEFTSKGTHCSRGEFLETLGSPILAKLPLKNFKVVQLDINCALVTYENEVKVSGNAKTCLRSSIWSRIDDIWKLRFHQATEV